MPSFIKYTNNKKHMSYKTINIFVSPFFSFFLFLLYFIKHTIRTNSPPKQYWLFYITINVGCDDDDYGKKKLFFLLEFWARKCHHSFIFFLIIMVSLWKFYELT